MMKEELSCCPPPVRAVQMNAIPSRDSVLSSAPGFSVTTVSRSVSRSPREAIMSPSGSGVTTVHPHSHSAAVQFPYHSPNQGICYVVQNMYIAPALCRTFADLCKVRHTARVPADTRARALLCLARPRQEFFHPPSSFGAFHTQSVLDSVTFINSFHPGPARTRKVCHNTVLIEMMFA